MKYLLLLLTPAILFAAPQGAKVVEGLACISQQDARTQIKTSHHAVIHWDSFSLAKGEVAHFIQPHSNSAVINRVSREVSKIDGTLCGKGQIYLLNPNGVLVGKTGVISCAAFAATTLDFDTEQCFKGGELLFKGSSADKIVNCGTIQASQGDILLLARVVVNEGILEAKGGTVGIAAAGEVLLKPHGVEHLYITPQGKGGTFLENRGVIEAARAELRADGNVYRLAINQSGVVEATGFRQEGGEIILTAEGGEVEHSGTLVAKSGSIHLLGGDVYVEEGSRIDVSGARGGGEVFIGGSGRGGDPDTFTARHTVVKQGALITACGCGNNGNGGEVIIWGDEVAAFRGKIEAYGGGNGGVGGFVEISSPSCLDFEGVANLKGKKGEFGTLFLSSGDLTISSNPDPNITFINGRVFERAAPCTHLDLASLVTNLNMVNVLVATQSSFGQPGDLTIENSILWNAPTTLTLNAGRDAIFQGCGFQGCGGVSAMGDGSIMISAGRDLVISDGGIIQTATGDLTLGALRDMSFTAGTRCVDVVSDTGLLTLNSGGNISLISQGEAAFIRAVHGDMNINQALAVNGGLSFTVGSIGSTHSSAVFVGSGNLNLRCGENLNVIGPGAVNRQSLIFVGGFGNFDIEGSLLVQGGSAMGTRALIDTVDGELRFKVGGSTTIQVGSGVDADAFIGYQSTWTIPHSSVDSLETRRVNLADHSTGCRGSSRIGVSTQADSANVAINAPSVVFSTNSIPCWRVSRVVSTGSNRIVPSEVASDSENCDLKTSGVSRASAQSVRGDSPSTLVPNISCGNFTISSDAGFRQENGTVNALLNGIEILPSPPYINPQPEQSGSTFSSDFGDFPRILFYQRAVLRALYNQVNQIFGEMFQKLHRYDQLLVSRKCFLLGYDKACYDQLSHPKGMVSSFDLFSEEEKHMLRRECGNSELKYIESF